MLSRDLFNEQAELQKVQRNSEVLNLFTNGVSQANNGDLIRKALQEDPRLATKVIFHLRDVRNGEGRRDIIKTYFRVISDMDPHTGKALLKHIPELGRWKDLFPLLLDNNFRETVLEMIKENINDGLLCKWLPREKSASAEKARIIREYLEMSPKEYRQHLSKNSSTVENDMCAKRWSEINYSHVPSVANVKYIGAFLRNDEDRRRLFLSSALKGTVKMNSAVNYPHNIVNQLKTNSSHWSMEYAKTGSTADACNALWKNLPNYMEDKKMTILPIIDTSGSMTTNAAGANTSCLEIAMGLGIYMAERNTGDLKDVWMNFSTVPKLMRLEGDTLSRKISSLDFRNWQGSTDLDAALDLVAKAISANPEENAVDMITIVSDMEFNGTHVRFNDPASAKAKFEALGVPMPQIVFWKVNGNGDAIPAPMDENNITVINGYSPSILKNLLAGEIKGMTAYESMLEIVEPKYNYIDKLYNK